MLKEKVQFDIRESQLQSQPRIQETSTGNKKHFIPYNLTSEIKTNGGLLYIAKW